MYYDEAITVLQVGPVNNNKNNDDNKQNEIQQESGSLQQENLKVFICKKNCLAFTLVYYSYIYIVKRTSQETQGKF